MSTTGKSKRTDKLYVLCKRMNNKLLRRVWVHSCIWVFFIVLIMSQFYVVTNEIPSRFLVRIGFNMMFFYINYALLVPKLLLRHRKIVYAASVVVLIAISYYVQLSNDIFLFERFPITLMAKGVLVLSTLFYIFLGSSIRVYEEWRQNERKKQQVETEKNLTELKALKHQINPHFLFNSLNSIYSLAVQKSTQTPQLIIMLSDLMRYMLYQTNEPFVLLKNELEYLQNYIDLQKMRLYHNKGVHLIIEGKVTDQKIRPLLFVSIVENAFKYGTDPSGHTQVAISVKVDGKLLYFECVNAIGDTKPKEEDSGIGLKNTKERFELLYPDKHEIKIENNGTTFKVNVKVQLT